MPIRLTSEDIAKFAAQPFIQRALQNPFLPESVLSFHLGLDFMNVSSSSSKLERGTFLSEMIPFWYAGSKEFDDLFQPFVPVIRNAANRELPNHPWNTTIHGLLAQILLTDQFSRNAFRGTSEAFAYDDFALQKTKQLVSQTCTGIGSSSVDVDEDDASKHLEGTFYVSYIFLLVNPYMHSERLEDHEEEGRLIEWGKSHDDESLFQDDWKGLEKYYLDHKNVVDRFRRYPHRNKKLGRESTPEELEWLADTENLPGWAKSQN